MVGLGYRATLVGPNLSYLAGVSSFELIEDNGQIRLYSGSNALGGVTGFNLTVGGTANAIGEWSAGGGGGILRVEDLTVVSFGGSQRLITSQTDGSSLWGLDVGAGGTLGTATQQNLGMAPSLSQITQFTLGGNEFIVGGAAGTGGLAVYQVQANNDFVLTDTLTDSTKAALGDAADLSTVVVGGNTYLLSGSLAEGQISTFALSSSGQATLVDTLGMDDGMWLSGMDSVATVTAGGVTYGVVAGTNSSSLTLVEINSFGAMRVTNHITDTLDTRFANVQAVETFSVNGRGFVVAGGSDDGLSLFEILPDNTFYEHQSIANQAGWTLGNVTAIKAAVLAGEVQIFAAGTNATGISQFTLNTGSISAQIVGTADADTLNGTAGDDLIFGGDGADALLGGAGDDILYGAAGADTLTGGAGADVFVFDSDLAEDRVLDFELGIDQLDLGRWGRIYDASSLTITAISDGAQISWGDYSVRVTSSNGQPIFASQFGDTSFRFSAVPEQVPTVAAPVAGNGAAVNGLGGAEGYGELALARSDDGSTQVDLSSIFEGGFNYFGTQYSGAEVYINTNGTLSFGTAFGAYSGQGTEIDFQDIIAPFWSDIDTRLDGGLTESGRVWVDMDTAADAVTITWQDVGGYRLGGEESNLFQLQLIDMGAGDFDIRMIYDRVAWTQGASADDLGAVAMLTGQRLGELAAIGGDAAALATQAGNSGTVGIWQFQMRAGGAGTLQPVDGLATVGTQNADVLEGGVAGDFLRGQDGNDILRGNDGNDWLRGGDGADTLNGGAGDDFIFGGETDADLRDVIYAGDGNDQVDGGYGNDLIYGGTGNDVIDGGFGADELIGQGGNDVLSGGALSDMIFGGEGNDFINGGFGYDRLNGGGGADRFYHVGIFDHGADWIQDYSAIEGDLLVWGGGAALASDFQVNFANSVDAGSAVLSEAFVVYRPSGQIIWALVDGGGEGELNLRIGATTYDLLL